jgi:MFS family permease
MNETQVERGRAGPVGWIVAAQKRLPRNVRVLGWVSLANDSASELAYPIVPLFLTLTLGAPVVLVGVIEGIAEAMAVGVKLVSGWVSDRTGERRRPWIVAGYGLSSAARVVVAAAPTWGWVLGGKIVDRVGKGARSTPRDALIRDSTRKPLLGAAFGYHRAMDTVGAVIGPLLAVALLELGLSLRSILWFAVVPGIATLVLLRLIREAPKTEPAAPSKAAATVEGAGALPASFWSVLAIWVIFSLGNSSDVFLLLRAHELGLATLLVVCSYAVYNLVYASLSWPFGALSDRVPRAAVLAAGVVVFGLVYVGFAVARSPWVVWPLFAVYGIYIAATEGVARAWVADHVRSGSVGTAYGVFYAATAAAALVASIVAGVLWTYVSPQGPFVLGAIMAGIAAVLLAAYALDREVSPRAAQVLLAGLAVAVVVGGVVWHGRLTGAFGRHNDADLPIAAARKCGSKPTLDVTFGGPFPQAAGVRYGLPEKAGPSTIVHGYRPGGIRDAHAAYLTALPKEGYTITREELDPADGQVDFAGHRTTGEVKLVQECRDRTTIRVTIRPA